MHPGLLRTADEAGRVVPLYDSAVNFPSPSWRMARDTADEVREVRCGECRRPFYLQVSCDSGEGIAARSAGERAAYGFAAPRVHGTNAAKKDGLNRDHNRAYRARLRERVPEPTIQKLLIGSNFGWLRYENFL